MLPMPEIPDSDTDKRKAPAFREAEIEKQGLSKTGNVRFPVRFQT
jgi:hypothetical protein